MKTPPRTLLGWLLLAALLPVPPGRSDSGGTPALQLLADKLSRQVEERLHQAGHGDPVVAVVVEGDQSIIGQGERINQELERLILYRLEAGDAVGKAIPLGTGGEAAVGRARGQGATLLLRCVVGVEGGSIQVTADLTPLHVPFWDRLVDPVPRGAKEHVFVATKVDDEIMVLLGKSRAPPPLGSWHLDEILYVPHPVLDAGLGNLDDQPGAELALLYPDAIEVFTLRSGQPKRISRRSLSSLPEAEVLVRDPAGSLLVVDFNHDNRYEIFYKLFDRRYGEILSWTGSQIRSLRQFDKVPLCVFHRGRRAQVIFAEPVAGTNHYRPEMEIVDINRSTGRKVALPSPFATLRCWQPGDGGDPVITTVDLLGKMTEMDLQGQVSRDQTEVGAGAHIADLDGDGTPEWILSEPVWPGEPDSVRVLSRSEVVWQSREIVGGVVAIASGDPDGRGKNQAVVAAVEPGGTASRIYLLGR